MSDWSKYPVLSMYRYGSLDVRQELDRFRADVRRAERERCAKHLRERYFAYATADAIEAMGDDDE